MMENKQSTVLHDNNVAFWDNKIGWKWNAITVLDSVPMEKRKDNFEELMKVELGKMIH